MRIYHGGYEQIVKPEIRIGKNNKDFGKGFYCTKMREQAERWALRFDSHIVSVYEYTEADGLNILNFTEMTDKWLDFIVECRNGFPHSYDIVTGAMANDQVWNYVADFISGVLTREQFWVLAKFKHPTHQIVFCTRKALECIKFSESYEVSL
jgi:hypothetical protein